MRVFDVSYVQHIVNIMAENNLPIENFILLASQENLKHLYDQVGFSEYFNPEDIGGYITLLGLKIKTQDATNDNK